ncbi:hypothetical protein Y1Q_0017641 [Alligator mississippiensis]|uniref:Uncharacterized protein n=1 Tax=Alligator mississippiensis TaxID=8496 RepID=A0A151NGS0_ALLMI|nr:hypothetical protein Y1Q_0017641 [Alligator mississippiensis]
MWRGESPAARLAPLSLRGEAGCGLAAPTPLPETPGVRGKPTPGPRQARYLVIIVTAIIHGDLSSSSSSLDLSSSSLRSIIQIHHHDHHH